MLRLFLTTVLLLSLSAEAGWQRGKINILYARASDGLHLVTLISAQPKTNSPACASKSYWLIKDENSTAGQSQFAQLLAAQAANKEVEISGLNTCSRWGDGEDINTIIIRN